MKLSWERISVPDTTLGHTFYRTATPTGWLVTTSIGRWGDLRTVFIPDPQHQWQSTGNVQSNNRIASNFADQSKDIVAAFILQMDERETTRSDEQEFIKVGRRAWAAQLELLKHRE